MPETETAPKIYIPSIALAQNLRRRSDVLSLYKTWKQEWGEHSTLYEQGGGEDDIFSITDIFTPWLPIGRIGNILVMGNYDVQTERPFPDWATQSVQLSEEDYNQAKKNLDATTTADSNITWHPPQSTYIGGGDRLSVNLEEAIEHMRSFMVLDTKTQKVIEGANQSNVHDLLSNNYAAVLTWMVDRTSSIMDMEAISRGDSRIADDEVCKEFSCVPVSVTQKDKHETLLLAQSGSSGIDNELVNHLEYKAFEKEMGVTVRTCHADEGEIKEAISGGQTDTRKELKTQTDEDGDNTKSSEEIFQRITTEQIESINPRKLDIATLDLFRYIIGVASKAGASDIHLQYENRKGRPRLRIDGDLQDLNPLPLDRQIALISVIKGAANTMKESAHDDLQDGAFAFEIDDTVVNVRCSALPHLDIGQKVVMRLLPKTNKLTASISKLEMEKQIEQAYKNAISLPQGLILIAGGTGTGKTTTLYSCLSELNRNRGLSITTIEDPVEYIVEGINQTQVNQIKGVTFSNTLRTVVRQDPDVILVGEIRDGETAALAIQAANTGHLVLSTIHANSATLGIMRMLDLAKSHDEADGVQVTNSSFAASVLMSASQRLIKRVCQKCAQTRSCTEEEKTRFHEHGIEPPRSLFEASPNGCASCSNTGYTGRVAIHEVVPATPGIKREIATDCRDWEIEKKARDLNFRNLFSSGLQRVSDGVTTMDEIMKLVDNPWDYLEHKNTDEE